jgi:hypothetical protein
VVDALAATVAVVALLPVVALAALWLRLRDAGPPVSRFDGDDDPDPDRQVRAGRSRSRSLLGSLVERAVEGTRSAGRRRLDEDDEEP